MKTITIINILGLDPATWTAFRALLAREKKPISTWARDTITGCVERDSLTLPEGSHITGPFGIRKVDDIPVTR